MERKPLTTEMIQDFETRLGYQFVNSDILKLALTHRSAKNQIQHAILGLQTNNEQLEFFGDALLGVFISEELIRKFPDADEGILSKRRSHIVDQKSLAVVATQLKLDELLILGPGEAEQGSNKKPRVLASVFEAVIADIYYDSSLDHTKTVVLNLLKHNISNAALVEFDLDFKTQLQELTQKLGLGRPHYKELASKGPSHQPEFLIALEVGDRELSRSVGTSKKRAEQAAAQAAFKELEHQNKQKGKL